MFKNFSLDSSEKSALIRLPAVLHKGLCFFNRQVPDLMYVLCIFAKDFFDEIDYSLTIINFFITK